ncbi:MAG: pilus assembly protein PilM [Candidatus Orphnella occulta]|nr:pilus assembly protein PilM [Candidatus Orphnella occulta]
MKFLFGKQKKIITVLELDNDWLKVVQVQVSGQERRISKIIVEQVASSKDDKAPDRISALLKELNVDSSLLTVSIPHQLVVIKSLELPSVNPAEVKDMVELQIGKQTPFTKEEIIYDYEIVSTNAEGYSRITLVIVHQDVVRTYLKTLEKAGLMTERIALSSEGLFDWRKIACKQEASGQPYALIDVDYDMSDFIVNLGDKVIFYRNISVGFLQSAEALDKWHAKFIEEINHSIYAYHSEMINEEITRIIITGAEILTTSLNKDILKAVVGLPVDIIPQTENITLTDKCLIGYSGIANNVSLSCLFGLALNPDGIRINLIPQQLQIEKEVREKGKDLYFFGMYLAFILAIASSIFLGRLYTKEQYLKELKQQVAKVQGRVSTISNMIDETETIKLRSNTKNLVLNCIFENHKIIPPDIYLTSIRFNGKDRLTIRGASTIMSEIFKFVNVLEESKYFEDVKTKFVTTRKVKGGDLTEFEIICPLDVNFRNQLNLLDGSLLSEPEED